MNVERTTRKVNVNHVCFLTS